MEIWDLYDKDRIKTDKQMYRGDPTPEGFYRIVVHLAIFDSNGRMLIQQRQPFKKGFGGLWDISVGGSAIAGDTSSTAVERELAEELGLSVDFSDIRPAFTVNFNGGFDDIYLLELDVDISKVTLQESEVCAVKWATREEILEMIDNGKFIPYHKAAIELMFFMKNKRSMHTI